MTETETFELFLRRQDCFSAEQIGLLVGICRRLGVAYARALAVKVKTATRAVEETRRAKEGVTR